MPYETPATSGTPMYIIYLIDMSESMTVKCGPELTRMDVVRRSLEKIVRVMLRRSRKGDTVSPKYQVSMVGYNHEVVDLLGSVHSIVDLERMPIPEITPYGMTNTYAAFEVAYHYLQHFLPDVQDCPAPMVCHLTDGDITTGERNIRPICDAIKQLGTMDGNVLIENIYIGDQLLESPITDVKGWPGVVDVDKIKDLHVRELWHVASELPASYAETMAKSDGYSMRAGSKMLIPAETPQIVELAFAMSGATPTALRVD